MKLVTTTDALEKRFGLKEAIRRIKEYGFDGYDCSLFESMKPGNIFDENAVSENGEPTYIAMAKEIRAYADSIGIPCLQTHPPLPTVNEHITPEDYVILQKKSLEISAILGAEVAVVHPEYFLDMNYNFDNIYTELISYAEKLGIKVATENMFKRIKENGEIEIYPATCGTPEEFREYIDFANSDFFTACLDIGHAELPRIDGAYNFIKTLGKRLGALHIHDNDKKRDLHVFPYLGSINWDEVCRALAEIDYQGNFTFEADATNYNYPNDLLPYAYLLLEKTGRYLISQIDKYRKEIK